MTLDEIATYTSRALAVIAEMQTVTANNMASLGAGAGRVRSLDFSKALAAVPVAGDTPFSSQAVVQSASRPISSADTSLDQEVANAGRLASSYSTAIELMNRNMALYRMSIVGRTQ